MDTRTQLSRRTALKVAATGVGAGTVLGTAPGLLAPSYAGAPAIRKPLPARAFVDFGTNAEMRWSSVKHDRYLTRPARLFVRDHTVTPTIDAASYRLSITGDGLRDGGASLSLRQLRRLPHHRVTTAHECTGNGRSYFGTQQGTPTPGTQWTLGSVGAITWEGVRLRDVLRHLGLRKDAVDVMATGLDPSYVEKGVDYGRVRRPIPIHKALDDAILAWGMNGQRLLPDHGFPLRLIVPGWVGIASIKWLGSLEVSRSTLTSPWNTKWYRMTGGDHPADSPPLTRNPVRSAWELAPGAVLPKRGGKVLHGRSWTGAGRIEKVQVSTDGGETWRRADLGRTGDAWTQWSVRWPGAASGEHTLLARATDTRGRTQPFVARYNDSGYFFDAVVKHPVLVG